MCKSMISSMIIDWFDPVLGCCLESMIVGSTCVVTRFPALFISLESTGRSQPKLLCHCELNGSGFKFYQIFYPLACTWVWWAHT